MLALRLTGEVAEWFKAHAWKACVGLPLPRVRIPPSPPSQGSEQVFYKTKKLIACMKKNGNFLTRFFDKVEYRLNREDSLCFSFLILKFGSFVGPYAR